MAQQTVSLTVRVGFEDPELLDSTAQEYFRQLDRGEMTEAEASANLQALALGMIVIGVE